MVEIRQPDNNSVNKKYLFLIGILLIVSLCALYFLTESQNNISSNSTKGGCQDERGVALLREASSNLQPENIAKLKIVADQVKELPNHQADSDCLNVITTYYIYSSDSSNATKYLDLLEKTYDDKKGFSQELGPSALGIETLRSNVAFLQDFDKNNAANKDFFKGQVVGP